MTLELCVPVHNEVAIIKKSLERICQTLAKQEKFLWRIVVVDNASTDGTAEEVSRFSDPRVGLLRTEEKGKGAAIIAAARSSASGTASLFGFIDADPSEIIKLVEYFDNSNADIVIGSRLLDTKIVSRGIFRSFSSKVFNFTRWFLLGISVQDSQCGLKLMNQKGRNILCDCRETGWFLDLEFLAKAEQAGLRVCEVPIRWNEFEFPERISKLKIIRDGFGSVSAMFRIRKRLRPSLSL